MAASRRTEVGRHYEERALAHLKSRGLALIARNFRTRFGELDLVMLDGDCLVFVEVRYRRRSRYLDAAASVDRHKQRRLALAAAVFVRSRRRWSSALMRFDVVAFDGEDPTMVWLRDAFRPGE